MLSGSLYKTVPSFLSVMNDTRQSYAVWVLMHVSDVLVWAEFSGLHVLWVESLKTFRDNIEEKTGPCELE